ncbi:hypothetical protein D3C76_853590 [compost metagenome]
MWQRQIERVEQVIALAQAEAHPRGAFVAQGDLGEHGIFLQVGQLRFEQFGGHGQQVAIALADDAEARQQASLDVAAATETGGGVVQVAQVAGQLALEEFAGVYAAYGEETFVVQSGEERGVGHCVSLDE